MTRRDFIGSAAAFAATGAVYGDGAGATSPDDIRAVLLHLGENMWCD